MNVGMKYLPNNAKMMSVVLPYSNSTDILISNFVIGKV